DAIGLAVPVVEDVKAILTRPAVELPDDAIEGDVVRAGVEDVRSHGVAESAERAGKVGRGRCLGHEVSTERAGECGVEERAGGVEGALRRAGRIVHRVQACRHGYTTTRPDWRGRHPIRQRLT